MFPLRGYVQKYDWGSHLAIATLLGEETPSKTPEAELWLGAHPAGPTSIAAGPQAGQTLGDLIAADPVAMLGSKSAAPDSKSVGDLGRGLPFLFKVLAAEQPLSLQAHPNSTQASEGFSREEAAGIATERRSYKDRSHKPELLCATSRFDALCGFRQPQTTLELVAPLGIAALDSLLAPLARAPAAAMSHGAAEGGAAGDVLRQVVTSLLSLDAPRARALSLDIARASDRARHDTSRFTREYGWIARIATFHPGDVGIALAMLLNLVTLEPGEALYLPDGVLHSYLEGVGVEIMASSDNVLRGGLTHKHVDVPELLHVLRFEVTAPAPLRPTARAIDAAGAGIQAIEHVYQAPAAEFRLSRIDLRAAAHGDATAHTDATARATTAKHGDATASIADRNGPEILLGWQGTMWAIDETGQTCDVGQGKSVFIPAEAGAYRLGGAGSVFRATVPHTQ